MNQIELVATTIKCLDCNKTNTLFHTSSFPVMEKKRCPNCDGLSHVVLDQKYGEEVEI